MRSIINMIEDSYSKVLKQTKPVYNYSRSNGGSRKKKTNRLKAKFKAKIKRR